MNTIDPGSLSVRSGGDPEAERTILFVHGLGESGLGFEALLAASELESWRCLAPDLPGYGRSPCPEEPLRLDDHANVLAAWMDDRKVDSAVVVGHSMGGVIALLLAESRPDLVGAFLNVEGNVTLDDCGFSQPISMYGRDEFLRSGFEATLDDLYRRGLRDLPLRGYYASMRFCDPATLHANAEDLVAVSEREETAARQARLGMPHRYLLGRPRGTGPRSQARLREAGVPLEVVEEAGHWPFLDRPEAFRGKLLSFLGDLGG